MLLYILFFFFNDTATTEIYTLSLHDALPIYAVDHPLVAVADRGHRDARAEVDQLVAVGVAHDAAGALGDVHRQAGAHARSDRCRLARLEGLRGRAGDGGREDPLLLDHGPILSAPPGARNYGFRGITVPRVPVPTSPDRTSAGVEGRAVPGAAALGSPTATGGRVGE